MTTVSDEIRRAAYRAFGKHVIVNDGLDAALEAVAPALRAEGMREAASISPYLANGYDVATTIAVFREAIQARAAELDAQKT